MASAEEFLVLNGSKEPKRKASTSLDVSFQGLEVSTTPSAANDVARLADLHTRFKSGKIAAGTFTGNPKTATVTFATPYADANYSISIIGADGRTWTYESLTANGFTINANANQALTGDVLWQTIKHEDP